jgi:O-antigen/teichoic acid export membrane protein
MSIRRNAIADSLSGAWAALLGFLFVPFYLRRLGPEAYGLVGVFTTIQTLTVLLDLGLTATINREMARLSASDSAPSEVRQVARSIEVVYWIVGLLVGVILAAAAPLLAMHWVKTQSLGEASVTRSLYLIAAAVAVQWPFSLYAGGLIGRQRLEVVSWLNAVAATARIVGSVVILTLVSTAPEVFFAWQLVVNLVTTALAASLFWRELPAATDSSRISMSSLKGVTRFAAGMSLIGVLSIALLQADKLVLSKVLQLSTFGYYILAWTVSSTLYRLVSPVFNAVSPRLTQLVAQNDSASLVALYHRSSRLSMAVVAPAAAIMAIFPSHVLFVWSGDKVATAEGAGPLALLAIGTMLHCAAHVPWALQLAYGWTSLQAKTNAIATAIFPLLCYNLAVRFGATGGAMAWLLMHFVLLVACQTLMHRRILVGEEGKWWMSGLLRPLAPAFIATGIVRALSAVSWNRAAMATQLMSAVVVAVLATAASSRELLQVLPIPATFLARYRSRASM